MSGPIASNPLDVCGAVVATCIGNALKYKNRIYAELLILNLSRRRGTSSSIILRLQPCKRRTAKERSTMGSQGILWEDVLLKVHLTRAVQHRCTASRHPSPATTGAAGRWEKRVSPCAAASTTTGNSENRSGSTGAQFD
jgi:hypothetical protein